MSEFNGLADALSGGGTLSVVVEKPAADVKARVHPANARPAVKKAVQAKPAAVKGAVATTSKKGTDVTKAAKKAAGAEKPAKKAGDLTPKEEAILKALAKKEQVGLGRKSLDQLGATSKLLGAASKQAGGAQGGGLMGRGLVKGTILEEATSAGDRLWYYITAKGKAALAKA